LNFPDISSGKSWGVTLDHRQPKRGWEERNAAFTRQRNRRIIPLPAEAGVPWS